jgi:organic radical activating enzyme
MVNEIRYTEIFYSLQGEGKYVGVPSVFFRTFGCNFRCRKFGLPKDQEVGRYNPEVEQLIKDGVHKTTKNFKDLPLVHTGCDTYASIYPEFKHFNRNDPIEEIPSKMTELIPNRQWTQPNGQDIHLIFTGGEPLLAWQELYPDLLSQPGMEDLMNITFETNTTQFLKPKLQEYLKYSGATRKLRTTFSCSPKLSVSGESWDKAINTDVAAQYYETIMANNGKLEYGDMYFKFVVATRQDVEEVQQAVSEYRGAGIDCPVYLMPLGGRSEEYIMTTTDVAELAMEQGWRFTPRLHIDLFGNKWGT